ncbi:hypothetical protein [Proteus phage vB_PmiP_RS51pmB]|nr:hypothetical protein [Proteus phage vB_PmiP_RS51pmB]
MKYTIVWNENKTEGIILSGEDRLNDAEHAANISDFGWCGVSSLAYVFKEDIGIYQKCTIQDGLVPMQPTDEMIKAGMDLYYHSSGIGDTVEDMIISVWQAMIKEMNK